MVVLVICAALACAALVAAPLVQAEGARDVPAVLVGRVLRLLPSGRSDWGRAMAGELDRIDGRRERWRFAGGSLLAVVLLPPGPARRNRLAAGGLWAVVAACATLTVLAFVRYPALRSGRHVAPAVVVLAVLLAAYGVAATVMISRGTAGAASLGAAVLVAGCWCGIGVATDLHAGPTTADVVLLSVGAVTVAAGVLRSSRPLLIAAVTGPILFLAWTAGVLATAGGPYDAGLVRDFPGSGFPDVATYAVSDGLGSAIALLLVAPLITAALAGAGAVTARAIRRR